MFVSTVLLMPLALEFVPQSVAAVVYAPVVFWPNAPDTTPQTLPWMSFQRRTDDVNEIVLFPGACMKPTLLSWMWFFAATTLICDAVGFTSIPAPLKP